MDPLYFWVYTPIPVLLKKNGEILMQFLQRNSEGKDKKSRDEPEKDFKLYMALVSSTIQHSDAIL